MDKNKKSKQRLAIAVLFAVLACLIIWGIRAPRSMIDNPEDVAEITFGYAYGDDTSVTAAGMIGHSDEIRSFSQHVEQYKYIKGKPLIKGKAVSPDEEPIWIAVKYKGGTADRFIVFPNGSFVAMKSKDTKPRVGHIGLFSSQKGVDLYEELVGLYPGR